VGERHGVWVHTGVLPVTLPGPAPTHAAAPTPIPHVDPAPSGDVTCAADEVKAWQRMKCTGNEVTFQTYSNPQCDGAPTAEGNGPGQLGSLGRCSSAAQVWMFNDPSKFVVSGSRDRVK
jgi:hypothetical protein